MTTRDRRRGRLIAYALVAVSLVLFPEPGNAVVDAVLPGSYWLTTAVAVAIALLVLLGAAIEVVDDKPVD